MDAKSTRHMTVGEQATLTESSNVMSPVMGQPDKSNLPMWPTVGVGHLCSAPDKIFDLNLIIRHQDKFKIERCFWREMA